jgi:hypothetical protein
MSMFNTEYTQFPTQLYSCRQVIPTRQSVGYAHKQMKTKVPHLKIEIICYILQINQYILVLVVMCKKHPENQR